jgi:hypothetical protein
VAAEQEQPKLQSPPRAYVNFAGGQGTPMEFALTLGYKEPDADPAFITPIVMSWEFVPVLIQLLQSQLDAYQEKVGTVRDIQEFAEKEGSQ